MTPEHHATWAALLAVGTERLDQEELKRIDRFQFTCADDGMTPEQKVVCIVEEVGEVARGVLEGHELHLQRAELVQVAALAVAWIEALDRELGVQA